MSAATRRIVLARDDNRMRPILDGRNGGGGRFVADHPPSCRQGGSRVGSNARDTSIR
jgi:hypothetical protein